MDYQSFWNASIFLCMMIILCGSHEINGIRLTNISVPSVADVRDDVELSCSYDMGRHKLNSVKWYKDEAEFFRYSPLSLPYVLQFPVAGVHLRDDYHCDKVTCQIHLTRLRLETSGSYKCEVSGDAPAFQLAHGTGDLVVAALPRLNPVITGITRGYLIDDYVIANCTSDMSNPPANLYWFIDNNKAPLDFLLPQHETVVDNDGYRFWYRSLGIRFHISSLKLNSSRRIIILRCVANIDTIPSAQREARADVRINIRDETTYDSFSSTGVSHHDIQFPVIIKMLTLVLFIKKLRVLINTTQ